MNGYQAEMLRSRSIIFKRWSHSYPHLRVLSYPVKDHITVDLLKKPAFDFKDIVKNIDVHLESAKRRGLPEHVLERMKTIPEVHARWTEYNQNLRAFQTRKNQITTKIKNMKVKSDKNPDFFIQLTSQKDLKVLMQAKEKELQEEEDRLYEIVDLIPNLIDKSVKDEEDIVKYINPKDVYEAKDYMEHSTIAKYLGILNLQAGTLVSGTSWYYLVNDGALLEQALVQYALSAARKHGFRMVIPPAAVKREVSAACGFKPRDRNDEVQTYELVNDNLVLTGTAEIPLAGMGIGKIFEVHQLPQRVVGLSRSYRAEAGSRGRDTKGLYRVHEFTKVELFVWSKIEDSNEQLEKIREFQEELIGSLGLTARVVNMPANDLGAPAAKKYDIEAWMPGRGNWGELTSASNCLDYQSRRMRTLVVGEKFVQKKPLHTLNGTAMAVPRVIAALIENFYDPVNERLAIPEVLQPYMDGKKFITRQDHPI